MVIPDEKRNKSYKGYSRPIRRAAKVGPGLGEQRYRRL